MFGFCHMRKKIDGDKGIEGVCEDIIIMLDMGGESRKGVDNNKERGSVDWTSKNYRKVNALANQLEICS